MKRSNINNEQKSDFNFISDKSHIENVWNEIEKNFEKYYNKIENPSLFFLQTLSDFHKEQEIYLNIFRLDNINEYIDEDEAQDFKRQVQNECPIIRGALHAKSEKLKKWQYLWRDPNNHQEILDTFFNIIDFAEQYNQEYNDREYSDYRALSDFEDISELNEKEFNVSGIVGAGISSSALYYLYPHLFNRAVKRTLYGFFFLSNEKHFGLPSKTNEFIMIDDTKKKSRNENFNHTIEQNYWYPYDLFMMYSKRIYDKIKTKHSVDNTFRYFYVFRFLDFVCKQHEEIIKTMTGNDQSDL